MSKYLVLLVLLAACASLPYRKGHVTSADLPYRKIPVASRSEARSVLSNHVSFLKSIFVQSLDPYYGTPKWPEECLEENHVGVLEEKGESLRVESVLITNESGEPGVCLGDRTSFILLYCPEESFVREYKVRPATAEKVRCD